MNQRYMLLELAIANDDLDLFFQGSGIYSFGDNKSYPVKRSVMADEAMTIIYNYYAETLNQTIIEDGIIEHGYYASKLVEEFPLSPLGAYNYLIYLREDPEHALANLKAGLPKK